MNRLDELRQELAANATGQRFDALRKFLDPRRDVDDECGYPKNTFWSADQYQDLYEREPVANRAIQLMPKEAWQRHPKVSEDEDSRTVGPFEQAIQDFGASLAGSGWHEDVEGNALWEECQQVNILARIGAFGLMLFGVDDGEPLDMPVKGMVITANETEPVLNRAGKQVGTRVKVVREGPVWEDGPVLRSELEALRNPKAVEGHKPPIPLTNAEREKVDSWERRWTEDAIIDATRAIVANKIGTVDEVTRSNLQGTDQQYYGVQFGDSQTEAPADSPKGENDVLFIRSFSEPLVQIVRYEWNIRNPRFGQPVMYRVTLNDPRQVHSGVGLPLATVFVHWSRVLHIADTFSNPGPSKIFAYPALMPILNPVLDIRKIRGASAEGYWRNGTSGLSLETHPALGGDVDVNVPELRDMMEQRNNGQDKDIVLRGMTAKTIQLTVSDPTPFINVQTEAICIQLGCPLRVFKGAERGELASSQDDADWNDRVLGYENCFCTPKIIVKLLDRLIMYGTLPEPDHYTVKWPDPEALSDQEKATIGLTQTQAMAAFIQGDVKTMVVQEDYMSGVLGFDKDKVDEWTKNAVKQAETDQEEASALADEHGMVPEAPSGFKHPEPPPTDNAWTDAAREAAAASRKAKSLSLDAKTDEDHDRAAKAHVDAAMKNIKASKESFLVARYIKGDEHSELAGEHLKAAKEHRAHTGQKLETAEYAAVANALRIWEAFMLPIAEEL